MSRDDWDDWDEHACGPEIEPDPGFWTTAQGIRMPISGMENGHLRNTIALLKRKGRTDHPAYIELLDEQYRRLGQTPPARETKSMAKKFYIIWNPSHPAPPRVQFNDKKKAEAAAATMAQRFASNTFYVCEAVSKSAVRTVVTEKLK